MRFRRNRTRGRDWDGIVSTIAFIAILVLIIFSFIPVRQGEAIVSGGSWLTRVELVEQDDKGDETTVSKRELEGDWSEDIQWPGSFVTGSDQRNRYTAIYTIGYQFEGATRSGRVSEREFGRYYLGMPCSITLNLYGSVIYDDCGLSTGR